MGGSFDFFRSTWLRTFNTTESTMKAKKPATARMGVDAFERKEPNGPATCSRTPMTAKVAGREALGVEKGRARTSCSSQISLDA